MKKQLLLMVLIIFMGCSSKSKTGDLIQANVTVFEIRGNGKQLNLPIFDEYVRVDEIESFVLEGEKVYESLAGLYDFKDYTLKGRGSMTVELFSGEDTQGNSSSMLRFGLEEVEIELLFKSFSGIKATYQIRFERNASLKLPNIKYQDISIVPGETVSIGTIIDSKENLGIIIALSFNHIPIDNNTSLEDILRIKYGNEYILESLTYHDLKSVENLTEKYHLESLKKEVNVLWDKLNIEEVNYSGQITLKPVTPESIYYPQSALNDSISGKVKIALDYNYLENDYRTTIVHGLRQDVDLAATQYLSSQNLTEMFRSNKPGFSAYEITVVFNSGKIPDKPEVVFIPYDNPPKPLMPINPKYPQSMKDSNIEGIVIVQIFVKADGMTGEMVIIRKAHPDLNASALDALRDMKWEPAVSEDKPVGVWVSVPINFKLETDKD